jgi:hypothetical protein
VGGSILKNHEFIYNIHGILSIASNIPLRELNYFRTMKYPNAFDLTVLLTDGIDYNFSILDKVGSYYGVKNGKIVMRRIHEYPIRSEILLKDLLGNTILVLSKYYYLTRYFLEFSSAYPGVNLIWHILRLKFLIKGYGLLHAGCISHKRSGAGILLVGYPDVGKTTTTLLAVKSGEFEYLSDDETIIDQNLMARAFPKILNFRNLEFAGFKVNIPFKQRFLSKLLEFFPWPFNVYFAHIEHLNPHNIVKVKNYAPIKYVFILENGADSIKNISSDYCMRKLWLNNHRQYGYLPEIFYIYAYFNDDFDLEELANKEKN